MDVVKVSGADSMVVNETMGMEVVVMADSGTSIPPRLLDLKLEEHQPIAVVVVEESDSKVASTPTVTDQFQRLWCVPVSMALRDIQTYSDRGLGAKNILLRCKYSIVVLMKTSDACKTQPEGKSLKEPTDASVPGGTVSCAHL